MNIVQWFKRVEMKVLKALSNRAEMYETIKIHVFVTPLKLIGFLCLNFINHKLPLNVWAKTVLSSIVLDCNVKLEKEKKRCSRYCLCY